MISEQQQALLAAADAASKHPTYQPLAAYLQQREKGNRAAAFKHLTTFISDAQQWPLNAQTAFLSFFCPWVETHPMAAEKLMPHPLKEKLVKPILLQWCKAPNKHHKAFRWYGMFFRSEEHLQTALQLCPSDDAARETLLTRWADTIYFSIHHLPDGYLGAPQSDLHLLDKIRNEINQLANAQQREAWHQKISEDHEIVTNYLAWKQSDHSNFAEWGRTNKKTIGYGNKTYPYNP